MSVEITGINEVNKNLNKILNNVKNTLPKALSDVALDLLGKAELRAPVDTGDLRGSWFTELTNNNKTAIIGFSTPYALRQHEELNYTHPLGGEPKYLENPFKENKNKYIQQIKDSVKKAVD